jgi:hypothetical protein
MGSYLRLVAISAVVLLVVMCASLEESARHHGEIKGSRPHSMCVNKTFVMSNLNQTRIWVFALFAALVPNPLACSQSYNGQKQTPSKPRKWLTCSIDWIFTSYTAHSDFTVKVVSKQAPVPDLNLVLEAEGTSIDTTTTTPSLIRKTDGDGVAAFSGIPQGKYWIRPDGLLPGSTEIKIDPDSNEPDDITLVWPLAAVTVRTVQGRIVSEKRKMPLEGVRVALLDVRTSSLIGDTYTNSQGLYELQAPNDGFFALRLTPRGASDKHEELAIEVRHDTASARLPAIRLDNSDCGLLLSFDSIVDKQH